MKNKTVTATYVPMDRKRRDEVDSVVVDLDIATIVLADSQQNQADGPSEGANLSHHRRSGTEYRGEGMRLQSKKFLKVEWTQVRALKLCCS